LLLYLEKKDQTKKERSFQDQKNERKMWRAHEAERKAASIERKREGGMRVVRYFEVQERSGRRKNKSLREKGISIKVLGCEGPVN